MRSLPRLDARDIIVQADKPTLTFQRWWQKVADTLEAQQAANDALDQSQSDALDFLDEALSKARMAYERIGPGAYSVTSSTTLPDDCRTALVDCTAGAVTVTLLPVADSLDDIAIKKVDASANAVTIDANGSETIDGAATKSLASQYNSKTVRPALGAWHLVAQV